MSTLLNQLNSRNEWLADGSQTLWNFTFAGPTSDGSLTYLSREHVKAFYDDGSGNRVDYVFADADWIGDYQVQTLPAPPAGHTFVIYRETPRERPLVDYNDGAAVSEPSLDTNARQAVYLAQEAIDGIGVNDDLGYKSMKHVNYTGSSTLSIFDNGRAHFKTDGTAVNIPNTLPDAYLTTIMNMSASIMTVTFTSAVGHRQGISDVDGVASFTIPAWNTVGVTKAMSGHFLINGYITL